MSKRDDLIDVILKVFAFNLVIGSMLVLCMWIVFTPYGTEADKIMFGILGIAMELGLISGNSSLLKDINDVLRSED